MTPSDEEVIVEKMEMSIRERCWDRDIPVKLPDGSIITVNENKYDTAEIAQAAFDVVRDELAKRDADNSPAGLDRWRQEHKKIEDYIKAKRERIASYKAEDGDGFGFSLCEDILTELAVWVGQLNFYDFQRIIYAKAQGFDALIEKLKQHEGGE